MPIKFRCQHCDQLMGISSSKAGDVVDCPTCGMSVRVPGLDGEVAPLPKPRLDLKDAELANALDELAALGSNQTLEKKQRELQSQAVTASSQERLAVPEEAFKAIPVKSVEPLSAPEPVESPSSHPVPETPATPVSQKNVAVTDATDVNHEEELSHLASLAQKRASNVLAEKKKGRLKRSARFELPTGTWVIILLMFGALTFSIGLLVGRNL
ncbi:zinc ribbon domain-containing protein [Gimesia panareensis]|nr:zinc ribbon domain-containing protein [Gimesia panareensis]